jgi:hypothetical protein
MAAVVVADTAADVDRRLPEKRLEFQSLSRIFAGNRTRTGR